MFIDVSFGSSVRVPALMQRSDLLLELQRLCKEFRLQAGAGVFSFSVSFLLSQQWLRLENEAARLLEMNVQGLVPAALTDVVSGLVPILRLGGDVAKRRAVLFRESPQAHGVNACYENLTLATGPPGFEKVEQSSLVGSLKQDKNICVVFCTRHCSQGCLHVYGCASLGHSMQSCRLMSGDAGPMGRSR